MAYGIGKGGLLAPEDRVRQDMILCKGFSDQIFAHVVAVHFQLRQELAEIIDTMFDKIHPDLDGRFKRSSISHHYFSGINVVYEISEKSARSTS